MRLCHRTSISTRHTTSRLPCYPPQDSLSPTVITIIAACSNILTSTPPTAHTQTLTHTRNTHQGGKTQPCSAALLSCREGKKKQAKLLPRYRHQASNRSELFNPFLSPPPPWHQQYLAPFLLPQQSGNEGDAALYHASLSLANAAIPWQSEKRNVTRDAHAAQPYQRSPGSGTRKQIEQHKT